MAATANLCIIPARGGSQRIPGKNIRLFDGRPIISYPIEAALESELFDCVMVSTDDENIARIAIESGAQVPFLRSPENSDDYAGLAEVLIEVIDNMTSATGKEFSTVCCILPTAALISAATLKKAFQKYNSSHAESLVSIQEFQYPIQRALKVENEQISMVWPENYASRSQDLLPRFHDAGQFYFLHTGSFLRQKKLFCENCVGYLLTTLEAQDVDSEDDWLLAEQKYDFLRKRGVLQ